MITGTAVVKAGPAARVSPETSPGPSDCASSPAPRKSSARRARGGAKSSRDNAVPESSISDDFPPVMGSSAATSSFDVGDLIPIPEMFIAAQACDDFADLIPASEVSMDAPTCVSFADFDPASESQAEDYGLLGCDEEADVMDQRAPLPVDLTQSSGFIACKNFLSNNMPVDRDDVSSILTVTAEYFASLPNNRGRFVSGILGLPQLHLFAYAMQLEFDILEEICRGFGLRPVENISHFDIDALAKHGSIPENIRVTVEELIRRRSAAFSPGFILMDNVSTAYLLSIHMVWHLSFLLSPLVCWRLSLAHTHRFTISSLTARDPAPRPHPS